jgi:rhodanese-related sulfurtransferase
MIRSITREEIARHLEAKTPMILVEALPEKYYRDGHLPGAINLPHDRVRELAAARLPNRDAFVVVYCANTPCQNSGIAARTLEAMGYTDVAEYVEGKQDWVDAGLALEKSDATKAE